LCRGHVEALIGTFKVNDSTEVTLKSQQYFCGLSPPVEMTHYWNFQGVAIVLWTQLRSKIKLSTYMY